MAKARDGSHGDFHCSRACRPSRTVATILPGRLLDLKNGLNTKVDEAQSRISQLIAQYKQFFLEEGHSKSEVFHAHQKVLASQSFPTIAPTCHATGGDDSNNIGSTSEIVEVGDEA
ncbi:hypothetical protein L7F22_030085 [Adiantum nelumboides]|nr:hypothetical protein [Adiantum nelumboides]